MAPHNFDGPSVSLLQIKYLLSLVKQKKGTAVLSVHILIRMLNQALSDVAQLKNKSSHLSSRVVIEHNVPRGWGTKRPGPRNDSLQSSKCEPRRVFRKHGSILTRKGVLKHNSIIKTVISCPSLEKTWTIIYFIKL